MNLGRYGPLAAMREDRRRFWDVRDRRVLIYWPHGFGDWVHLGHILPLLEPANRYAVTRYGDDYVSVMEGNALAEPLAGGIRAPADGRAAGAAHLGLKLRECNGAAVSLELPEPLFGNVRRFAPQVLLWTDYPETEGRTAYPFHTKARNLVRLLVPPERHGALGLSHPLRSALDFTPPRDLARRAEDCLARFAPPGTRLCLLSRRGVTAARKNWGDGTEARAFVAALRRRCAAWRVVSMDDEELGEGSAGFREIFGGLGEPFGRLFKAVAARADLFVGVPSGPLHFTLARGGVPAIGVWLAHHPDWYDEPNPDAIHLIGRYVRERRFDRRPATTSKPAALRHRVEQLDTFSAGAETVVTLAAQLTG